MIRGEELVDHQSTSPESSTTCDGKRKALVLDITKLPKAKSWFTITSDFIFSYQGCWFPPELLPNVVAFQQQFQAHDQDIVLASNPKSGTTWLKALLFSITNRTRYSRSDTPLHASNPHDLVPHFEIALFSDPPGHNLSEIRSPRLFATHISYASLPDSITKHSECRIVYICRNPLDTITSFWHYMTKSHPSSHDSLEWNIEKYVEIFCKGENEYGPFWDHVLGFWKASLEKPEKVLFLKYEDMVEDTASQVKRLAEFVGFPFSEEEESNGVVEQIVELCSLKNLKELDVNKHGKLKAVFGLENKIFFRKGQVGDWINHLSPAMVESVNKVIREKLHDSGLTFKYCSI